MKYPILIASKGRANESYLLSELRKSDREWWYVVEPQDEPDYRKLTDNLIILPKNDQGIAYVRQFILELCKDKNTWYWTIDDDITQFYKTVNNRNQKSDMESALSFAESALAKTKRNIGQMSLDYQQMAWSSKKPIHWNRRCDVCVLINPKVPARYRKEVELKEDRDFTLQVLAAGYSTGLVSAYSIACPAIGMKPGGLQPLYQKQGKLNQSVKRMCELWPGICTSIIKKDGSPDAKIDWKVFQFNY